MKRIVKFILIVIVLCYTLLPIYWIVVTSLKPPIEYTTRTPALIPERITFEHYHEVIVEQIEVINMNFISGCGLLGLSIFLSIFTEKIFLRRTPS